MKYIIIAIISLIFISGCKKDDKPGPVPVQQEIMKLNFTNDFIPDPFKVIVSISLPDGSLYADTSFSDNGTHSVMTETATDSVPASFSVTIIRYDLYWHNVLIQMNTFQDVSKGEWTIAGIYADTIGQATVSMENIPEHSGLILYSNQGYYNYTTSVNPQTCRIYADPDDFYLKMKTSAGQRFKWLSNFSAGNQYTLDLSSMEVPDSSEVSFPFSAGYYEARLWGFANDDYELSKAFLFDMVLAGLQPKDKVMLNYPPGEFTNYRTYMLLRESFVTNTEYFCNTIGAIPTAFTSIDATISDAQLSGNVITLSTSGQYDSEKAYLYYSTPANEIFEWNIYAPANSANIIVPEISPLLVETFPSSDTAHFELRNSELIDFDGINSYGEMIQALFSNDLPRDINQLDYHSVVQLEE